MDNPAGSKSHIPCQSWADQNGWSTTSTSQLQGALFNSLPNSQHLILDSSSGQIPSCDLQAHHRQSCMMDISSTLSASHHSALYKATHSSSNSSSNSLFANSAFPDSSQSMSFVQQSPHTSPMLLTGSQGKNMPPPSLLQTNQVPQPCSTQQPPLISTHNPYKGLVQPQLTIQGFPSLPSCEQQRVGIPQATSEGANVEFAGVFGNTLHRSSSTQPQWISLSHCREAPNESVPDAAPHHNENSSQEGNVTPLASDVTRRSALLHQRAQLLQQLAELDKYLETAPPDDGKDEESPHIESPPSVDDPSQCEDDKTSDSEQVQLSALKSESSPENYDQNETCDTPEDPVSEAESVKKENFSDESEGDSDADYCPKHDSDSSSDEASNSKPLTPTDERPSVPGEKRAASETDLLEDTSVSPPKRIRPANLKKSSQTPVLPCSYSEKQRIFDRKNYCLFCSKPVTKMSRHLEMVHSDKPEVAAAFQFPKKSKERLKIWNRLVNQGNFAHNKAVLKTGQGQLAARHRPKYARQAQDFLHCLYCRGLLLRTAMFRHLKSCPEKGKNEKASQFGRRLITSRFVLEAADDLGISDGLKNILSKMIYDDVTQTIMDDEVILQFGEFLYNHYGNDVKKCEYIRQKLREIARLVLEAQNITPLKKLEEFFLPSSFPYVVSAVNVLAGYDAENKTYSSPSLAIKLGYDLQKACNIVESNAVKAGNESLAESARKFLSVYRKKWNKLISGGALTTIREIKSKNAKKVPLVQDVKRLSLHLENVHALAEKKLRDSTSVENYAALVKVMLARIAIFNRRILSTISMLKLKDFLSREKSNLHAGSDITMSNLEKKMCQFFTRIDIQGNCGRMVPVILKPSFVSAVELFINAREPCGIPSENSFLFARPNALTSYSASVCIQQYAEECGVKDPDVLIPKNIRKYYATLVQMINLDEDEAKQILGPNNQVQNLRQNINMQLDDIDMDSDGIDDRTTKSAQRKCVYSGKKGAKTKGKRKWEEAEVQAVEKHMMRFIQGHKIPQKDDCVQCLMAEQEALRRRSWRGVKDYVRNRITTLKCARERDGKDSEAPAAKTVSKQHRSALDPNRQVRTSRQTRTTQQEDADSDSRTDSDERLQPARARRAPRGKKPARRRERPGTRDGPAAQTHHAGKGANKAVPLKSINSGNKGAQSKGKQKWDEAEVLAVERHMMSFIEGYKVPQKGDCIQCLSAEPHALSNRSWKGVKDYVRNRITSLKRQRKTLKAKSRGTSQVKPTNDT